MTTALKRAWLLATFLLLVSTVASVVGTTAATQPAWACPPAGCGHDPDDDPESPKPKPNPPPPDLRPDVLLQLNDTEVCDAPDNLREKIINGIASNLASEARNGITELGTYYDAVEYSATCRPNELLMGLWYSQAGADGAVVRRAGPGRAALLQAEASIDNGWDLNVAFRVKAIRSLIKAKANQLKIPYHRFNVPTGSVYIWDLYTNGISPNRLETFAPVDFDTDLPYLSDTGYAVIDHDFWVSGGQLQCSVSAKTADFNFLINAVASFVDLDKMVEKHAAVSLCQLTNKLPTTFNVNNIEASLIYGAAAVCPPAGCGHDPDDDPESPKPKPNPPPVPDPPMINYGAVDVDSDRLMVSGSITMPPIDKTIPDPASRMAPFTKGTEAGFVYRSYDAHVQLVTGTPATGLQRTDLTTATNTPLAAGDPSVYVVDGITSVVYRVAGTNRIMQLYQSGWGWWYYDLHYASGGGAPLAAGDPIGYEVDGDQFVAYRASGGQVVRMHQYGTNGWGWVNLIWASGSTAPTAASDVTAYVRAGRQHVAYRTTAGHIAEIRESAGTWMWRDLHAVSGGGADLAVGAPASYVLGVNGAVMYRTASGDIIQMYGADGSWGWQNLHWASGGGSLKASSDPTGYVLNGVTNSVLFRNTNGSVVQMYQTGTGGWAWASLQWKSGNVAPMAKGVPAGTALGGTQFVLYDGQDGRLHLLYATSAWTEQPIG